MVEIWLWTVIVVLLLSGLNFFARGVHSLVLVGFARHWPQVEGEIVASEIDVVTLRGAGEIIHTASGYIPRIQYSYPLRGVTLHGHRIAMGERTASAPYHSAKALADQYRPGSKVAVIYHPQKPALAALKPGRPIRPLLSVFTGALLVGLSILIAWHG